jgi:hypothetical protein
MQETRCKINTFLAPCFLLLVFYATVMTDAPAPTITSRGSNAATFIFAVLAFVIAATLAGLYIWDRQQKNQELQNSIIDQLIRIDARLTKLEGITTAQDTNGINEKLEQLQLKLSELTTADNSNIAQQLQIIIEHQIKLQNDLADIKEANAAATAQHITAAQTDLLADLRALAPHLILPPAGNDFWSKIIQAWQQWVTVQPQASASADITTPVGKISRALYALEQGDITAALKILPDDPRLSAFRVKAANILVEQTAEKIIETEPTALPLMPDAAAEGTMP